MTDIDRWAIGIGLTIILALFSVVLWLVKWALAHTIDCRDFREKYAEKLGKLEGKP